VKYFTYMHYCWTLTHVLPVDKLRVSVREDKSWSDRKFWQSFLVKHM